MSKEIFQRWLSILNCISEEFQLKDTISLEDSNTELPIFAAQQEDVLVIIIPDKEISTGYLRFSDNFQYVFDWKSGQLWFCNRQKWILAGYYHLSKIWFFLETLNQEGQYLKPIEENFNISKYLNTLLSYLDSNHA